MADTNTSLKDARDQLDKVNLLSKSSEPLIDEGFFALEEIADSDASEKSTAENLGHTYMGKFQTAIKKKLLENNIPEPKLKALLGTVTALETSSFALEFNITALKGEVASRLMDTYFRGYSEAEKSKAIQDLMERIEKERDT